MDVHMLDIHFTIRHKSGEIYDYVKRANSHAEIQQIVKELIELNVVMQEMTNSSFKIGYIRID